MLILTYKNISAIYNIVNHSSRKLGLIKLIFLLQIIQRVVIPSLLFITDSFIFFPLI
jgi:hypothetical protein